MDSQFVNLIKYFNCYLSLLTNDILKQLLSEKQTNSSRSGSAMFTFWINEFSTRGDEPWWLLGSIQFFGHQKFSSIGLVRSPRQTSKRKAFSKRCFHSKLCSCNPLEANSKNYVFFVEKWRDQKTSFCQVKIIKDTTYWCWELSIP